MGSIEIFVGGDFFGGNRVGNQIYNESFDSLFGHLLTEIRKSDISLVNLESPVFLGELKPISKTGPNLKASPDVLNALKFAGFDLITLANNHILDYGVDGLQSTIESIKKEGLEYVGAGLNKAERRGIKYISKKSKKVAFLNFCENEWSTSEDNQPGANPLNIIDNFADIKSAKETADYLIVILHGSIEHFKYPTNEFIKTCKFYIDAGADSVICHHTHVVSGYEIYKGKPIFYGIGNFVFDNKQYLNSDWNIGCAIKLSLGTEILFEISPFWQCNNHIGIEEFSVDDKAKFQTYLNDLNQVISDEEQLESEFLRWCLKKERMYDSYLQPYKNRILKGLFTRKLFPSLHSKQTYSLLLNLMRCESHRVVLMRILNNKL